MARMSVVPAGAGGERPPETARVGGRRKAGFVSARIGSEGRRGGWLSGRLPPRRTYLRSNVSGAEQQQHLDVESGVGDAAARRGHVADAVKLEEKVARHGRFLQFRAQARCSSLLTAYVLRLAARDNFANVIPAMHF